MASYENHLQFAFPGPYDESLKFNTFAYELSNVDEVIDRVRINGISANVNTNPIKVYVNTFIDVLNNETETKLLDIDTDYFTYMLLNDNKFIGSFSGIVDRVPAPTGYYVESSREPNLLQLTLTFNEETIGGVPFDVFVKIGDNNFTNVSPNFSNDISRTFSFNSELPDGSLIDTVTMYTAHVYVVNKHSSNITTTFNVQGTSDSQFDSSNIEDFELVSMGNLDTDGDISLSVDFTGIGLSNVTYYITAYSSQGQSQAISILDMIQSGTNVETGSAVTGSNTVVITKDFQGYSFEKNGNIDIKGLFIHEDTYVQLIMELTNITMDVPVIDANVFAAPMFKN